jgi:DNA-binding NtrC family response regulator
VIVGVDEPGLRERVAVHLDKPEIHLTSTTDVATALREFGRTSCDLVVLAGSGPDEALEALSALAGSPDRPRLVVLLENDYAEGRARLLAAGALAVLDLGLEDRLLGAALDGLIRQRVEELRADVAARRQTAAEPPVMFESPAMLEVVEMARKVAMADSSVLVLGETGVGKERIAELIHRSSARSAGPFVPVNCAAIPAELFESELFGHERGAFTGAHRAHRGLFEQAHEGTLFLDEVGELPGHLQPKLLRALQERKIRPLGSSRAVDVDTRVVAATQRDLTVEMANDRFRRDLYYRLAVVELTIPPLRQRPEDVRVLTRAFVRHFAQQTGRSVSGVEPEAMEALVRYAWPGNVRELINVLERAVLLCENGTVRTTDLPPSIHASGSLDEPSIAPADSPEAVSDAGLQDVVRLPEAWLEQSWKLVREGILVAGERAYLVAILSQTQGRVGEAAKRAGLSTRALFEKMRRLGLRKEDFR